MKYILSLIIILLLSLTLLGFDVFSIKQELQKKVYLKVEKNDTILKSIILEQFQNEFFNDPFLSKSISDNENIDLEFSLSTPKLFRFYSLKPQTAPLLIFVQPGDSVSYKLAENNSISFEGKNAFHYNFFNKINNPTFYYPAYTKKDDVWKYKKSVELIYKKRLLFLEKYVKDEKVSDLFTKRIKDILKYEYLNWLLNRFIIPKNEIGYNSKYLEGIDFKLFNKNDQEDNDYFYLALTNYLHFSSIINEPSETYSKQKLEFQLNFIKKNLSGNTREYAITKTLFEYDKYLKSDDVDFFKNSVNSNLTQIKAEKYKIALEKIKQRLLTLETELPKEVLNSMLMDIDGNTISFGEILKNKGSNVKVIDFWASWCAPCISEIKNSYLFRNKLIEEKKTEFLYFSVDKNQEKWKNKIQELKKIGMNKNQYLIVENTNSILGKYFAISSIPRYVVLNSKNSIYMNTIPSPSETLEFEKIINEVIKWQ